MSKIKIISNPYHKETVFQSWDDSACEWRDIDRVSNANSGLLSDGLHTGFFPFKAKQILDIMVTEYFVASEKAEKIEIEFQGTDDEYRELESICDGGHHKDKVYLARSAKYLENARDILPDVIEVFKKIKLLVAESVSDAAKTKRDLEKFSDASNDIIPICVIGNYSSGKSTFINALIGYELLPSSDEPTTAKIYKITQSKHTDRAKVEFESGGEEVCFRLTADSFKFISDLFYNPLSSSLKKLLAEIARESIPAKLSRVLEMINASANETKDDTVSDLIQIEAPFDDDGLWSKIASNFVIFDTPGSNSASNVKHYQVLKKAMEDLSNGLPIFISEYDSLDSTDNDKLYQDINNMEELDNRFTMIIVNKADAASLTKTGHTEDDRDRILNLAIPRNLYSGGIYFVSSIIGLGAKNDGEFISDHNAEVFEDQKNKYIDSSSKFYKQLYRYNILPEQIKEKYDSQSVHHGNLLYANSGLYCIEQAIWTFAGVYSHYNKCQQSKLFLDKIIQITSNEISDATRKKEEYRARIITQLERDKSELIERLEKRSKELREHFIREYPVSMEESLEQVNTVFTYSSLKEREEVFLNTEIAEKDIAGRDREVSESWKNLLASIRGNVSKVIAERNITHLRDIGETVTTGIKEIYEKNDALRRASEEAKDAASDELISFIRESFSTHVNEAQTLLENKSRAFWAENTERFKRELSQIVTESTALTTEKRGEIAEIIIEYRQIVFENKVEVIFDKETFRRRFFGDANRLDIDRLARRYNSERGSQVREIYKSFEESHAGSFEAWMNNLMAIIMENIVEFSPKLREQAEMIREETTRIAELESRKAKLDEYTSQVRRMMDWKDA